MSRSLAKLSPQSGYLLLTGSVCLSLGLLLRPLLSNRQVAGNPWYPSPRETELPRMPPEAIDELPYPPDVLPGGRDVETPYGTIKVFEWGPERGQKVLLLHGLGIPSLALSEFAEELVRKGYRVMLFDYFGRGYSDAPNDLPYDMRLYTTQILLVLASSSLAWTGGDGFHLVGYSLGGGLAVSFTRYFAHMVRSLTLVAPGGILRRQHVSWKSKMLYSTGIFPEWMLEGLVRSRLEPKDVVSEAAMVTEVAHMDNSLKRETSHDATGGSSFDNAVLLRSRPSMTVAAVLAWQLRHHPGFVPAYMSSFRYAPIYEQRGDWHALARLLAERRQHAAGNSGPAGLRAGKILVVLGSSDPIVGKEELLEDAGTILGRDSMEIMILDAGHEVVITYGDEIARAAVEFWER